MGCRLAVKLVPGASRSGLAGWLGETLKVRVVTGAASARRLLEIDGLDARAVRLRLAPEERS